MAELKSTKRIELFPGEKPVTGTPYQYGTAVPVKEKDPADIRREKNEYMRMGRMKVEERYKKKRRLAPGFSAFQIILIALSLAAILFFTGFYIVSISATHEIKTSIQTIRKEYQDVSSRNLTELRRLENNIDYSTVYAYVTETLGMRTPEKQQIIRYTAKSAEFVTKDSEIPHE